jgi:hypothetical protein
VARNTAQQGARLERDVRHYLDGCQCETERQTPVHIGWRGFGYDSLRSAGSKGKIDVMAIGPLPSEFERQYKPTGETLLFIQCKLSNPVIPPADRASLRDLAGRAGALPLVAYKARDRDTGRLRPHFRLLTGPGPKHWVPWVPGDDC